MPCLPSADRLGSIGPVSPLVLVPLLLAALFAALMGCLTLGWWIGRRRTTAGNDLDGMGVIDGAVFALLGLLMAFTFYGAADRFERRRALIVQEANAIGTAYLRLDLLPPATQPALRENFRRYIDARLAIYKAIPDAVAVREGIARSTALQEEIWKQAISACEASPIRMENVVLPALNEMIDITTTRTMAAQTHPPLIIFLLLVGTALVASLLAGHGMSSGGRWSRLHSMAFAVVLTATIYVIVDLEFPRLGLVQVSAADQLLVDVRSSLR
jgi:hypothetical protein